MTHNQDLPKLSTLFSPIVSAFIQQQETELSSVIEKSIRLEEWTAFGQGEKYKATIGA
jgi:hypothetical protein